MALNTDPSIQYIVCPWIPFRPQYKIPTKTKKVGGSKDKKRATMAKVCLEPMGMTSGHDDCVAIYGLYLLWKCVLPSIIVLQDSTS